MAELSGEQLRSKVNRTLSDGRLERGSPGCVFELAALAVNKRYTGFADARVAAINILGKITGRQSTESGGPAAIDAQCERAGCGVRVSADIYTDEMQATGRCAIEGFCAKDIWPDDDKPTEETFVELRKETIVVRGQSLGFVCPHVSCGYSCGLSGDMIPGEIGDCLRQDDADQETTV